MENLFKANSLRIIGNYVNLYKSEILVNRKDNTKLDAIRNILIGMNKILILFSHKNTEIWEFSNRIEKMIAKINSLKDSNTFQNPIQLEFYLEYENSIIKKMECKDVTGSKSFNMKDNKGHYFE
jgi:hypothetical protein